MEPRRPSRNSLTGREGEHGSLWCRIKPGSFSESLGWRSDPTRSPQRATFPLLMSKANHLTGQEGQRQVPGLTPEGSVELAELWLPPTRRAASEAQAVPVWPSGHPLLCLLLLTACPGESGQPPAHWLPNQTLTAAWPRPISNKLECGCLGIFCQTRVPQEGEKGVLSFSGQT